MGEEQLCQAGPVVGPWRVPQGRQDGDKSRPGEGEGESGWREMPQVGFGDSFYFTKYKGTLQKLTRN